MSQSRELGRMTIAGSLGPAMAGVVVSAREGSPGMCLGRRTGVAGRAPTRPVPPSDSTTPSDPSGRPMCTAQTRPASPPANDVEPGEEDLGFVVIGSSALLRLPAAEGVGFDSAGACGHRDGN